MPVPRPAECVTLAEVVFPEATNHYGTLFGGRVLDLMDRAAFLAATRFTRQTVVTVATERIEFHVPIKHGQIIELVAKVVFAGRTSVTVRVDLYAEDALEGSRAQASSGYFHLVAVDAAGRPVPVPELLIDTLEAEHERQIAGELRAARLSRLQRQQEGAHV